jgi:hypothetical protein
MRAQSTTFSRTVCTILAASILVLGCKNEDAAKATTAATDSPTGEVSQATGSKVAQSSFDEAAFAIRMVAANPIKSGETGELTITLTSKSPFHVNAEYPHRFKVATTKGGNAPKATVNVDSTRLKPTQLELSVPVVPAQVGSGELEGEFSFSVCTDEKCLMEKRQLKASFQGI